MNKWIKKDLTYNWHPYTQMKDCAKSPPILIKRAKGIKLYDDKGRAYCDTISSWWCNVHGHNHPTINKAINKQLKDFGHILFAGFTHKPAIKLAEKLIEITPPNLKRVFFSDNGSTAVEVALKMSYQYWQNSGHKDKNKFVSLDYGYHGDTIGTMSLSGVDLFNRVFKPLFFKAYKSPSPYCYRCPQGKEKSSCAIECIKPLEKLLKTKHKTIAAFIIEPLLMAAGGMIIYPPQYLKLAARLCKKYNIHLILDEVATGFGRTAKMFACQHAKVEPDFICVSKGITSGYLPISATLTTNKIYRAFYADYQKQKTFYHGHTYTANAIACAAALGSIEVFRKEDTLNKVNKLAPYFHKRLEEFRKLPLVGDVRYLGMVAALELVKNKKTKKPFDFKDRIGQKVYKQGLKQGLILRPLGNIVYFYLPLCIKRTELDQILAKTLTLIKNLKK